MDKIIKLVLEALKTTYDLLKPEILQKVLSYIISKAFNLSKGYSEYLVVTAVMVVIGLVAIYSIGEDIAGKLKGVI
jgi:hypothetical protein